QLEMEMYARRNGAVGTSFDIVSGFIQPGSEPTGSIFGYGADEGLRNGTTIFFDVGFVVDGYCSDWGRTVYFGSPSTNHTAAYSALQRAVTGTIGAIQVGRTRVCDLYPMLEERLDGDGYGDYLRARLPSKSVGHQIGIEVHESPWLEPQNTDLIVPGMVFCVEPKLWDDGEYYMRVEDMVLITDSGAEALTTFDRDLFEL
ncbi:MAG: aminopeptidase P family protein, partial [Spirochaetales bacterium]